MLLFILDLFNEHTRFKLFST